MKADRGSASFVSSPAPNALHGAQHQEWRRWVFLAILFLVTTSSYCDFYILAVVLEPIKREFQVSDTQLGLLSGPCFAVFYGLAAIPIARWADRGNRPNIMCLAVAIWSAMTALGSVARSFGQLAATRIGIGIVEPGALPVAQSLVADYFSPAQRATASAILVAGSSAGYLVGVGLGGMVAAEYGWRAALLMLGVPGLLLALAVRWQLPEPRKGNSAQATSQSTESLGDVVMSLLRKKTLVYTLLGMGLYGMFAYGVGGLFIPTFMIRTLHASLEQVSMVWGIAISIANLLGAITGGWLADRLARRDVRWYLWLPALACVLGGVLYWIALRTNSLSAFIAPAFTAEFALSAGICLCFVPIHVICGAKRRTTAVAMLQMSIVLVGSGLGPLLSGVVSDALRGGYGDDSLRYSLLIMVGILLPAAAAFQKAGRTIISEIED